MKIDNIMVIITIIVILIIVLVYKNLYLIKEHYKAVTDCDIMLYEFLDQNPKTHNDTKKHFLTWCRSHWMRYQQPDIEDARRKFLLFDRTNRLTS